MVMTPGEVQRTKDEADAAWDAIRTAQGVVQRLIDEPTMPRAYREADLEETRCHLGRGLKAVNATRHRLELAALLGEKTMPPLYPRGARRATEWEQDRIRDEVERHYRGGNATVKDAEGYIVLNSHHRIHPVTYALYVHQVQADIYRNYVRPKDRVISVAPKYHITGWSLPNLTETHETTEAGEVIESHTIYPGMGAAQRAALARKGKRR